MARPLELCLARKAPVQSRHNSYRIGSYLSHAADVPTGNALPSLCRLVRVHRAIILPTNSPKFPFREGKSQTSSFSLSRDLSCELVRDPMFMKEAIAMFGGKARADRRCGERTGVVGASALRWLRGRKVRRTLLAAERVGVLEFGSAGRTKSAVLRSFHPEFATNQSQSSSLRHYRFTRRNGCQKESCHLRRAANFERLTSINELNNS